MSNGSNPDVGGDGGGFAFGFVPSNGHHSSVGGRAATAGAGRGSSGGGGRTPQAVGSGSSPPSWWRGLETGAGEVDHEAEGGRAAFGEELEVFSSALRKDFELKVRASVGSDWLSLSERDFGGVLGVFLQGLPRGFDGLVGKLVQLSVLLVVVPLL